MTASHPHKRPNIRHPAETDALTKQPDVAARLNERFRVEHKELPSLAATSVDGKIRYIDPVVIHALVDNKLEVPGLKSAHIVTALVTHEGVEKALMDALGMDYAAAHDHATIAEHNVVRQHGGAPHAYEAALKPIVAEIERRGATSPPPDLAAAPYLDEPDEADTAIAAKLKAAGVTDAAKLGRKAVEFGKSAGKDQCGTCRHKQGHGDYTPCALVNGLVRPQFWCNRFER